MVVGGGEGGVFGDGFWTTGTVGIIIFEFSTGIFAYCTLFLHTSWVSPSTLYEADDQ